MRANVLIVNDDANGRQLTSALVTEMGYDVTSVASAEEALRYLYSEEPCDVILADFVMAGMWGLELSQRIQEARPGLPFVLMSGNAQGLASAVTCGRLAVTKPCTRAGLTGVLEQALAMPKRTGN